MLGKLPERSRAISVRTLAVEERGTYIAEKLLLDLNGIELVPAYFTKPKGFRVGQPVKNVIPYTGPIKLD